MSYLRHFGYLPKANNPEASALISDSAFSDAVRHFQRFANLDQTGILDDRTREMMQAPRCGVPDIVDPDLTFRALPSATAHPRYRAKRYALQGSKWRVKDVTWRVSKPTSDMPLERTAEVLGRALQVWADVSQLEFTRKRQGDAHIEVRFEKYEHGDGDPFDGPGKTLAHAFFPMFGGDAHFDDSEYWTAGTWKGTNLFQVAAHEFGHSLGLSHSDVRSALMAPFYRGYDSYVELDADDVQAIQYLYGANTRNKRPHKPLPPVKPTKPLAPKPPKRESSGPNVCTDGRPLTLSIDAMTRTADGSVYAFVGSDYYKLNDEGAS